MLGKVRPPTHRGNGSDPQPKAGLSEGRLALVHRYMIDAEEAEARAQAAAEKAQAQARAEAQTAAASEEQARREAAEREPIRLEMERRRAEKLLAEAATPKPDVDASARQETLPRAPARAINVASLEVDEAPRHNGRPDAKETRTRKALATPDKRAAKQAARRLAALEKREARERRALAKAAARRRSG